MKGQHKVGERWEITKKGITYLVEKQTHGRAKIIERITPYKNPKCANTLSKVPATMNRQIMPQRKPRNEENYGERIYRPRAIQVRPFDPATHRRIKLDGKTYKEVAI